MPVDPDQFFTPVNIVSAGVATLAVNVVTNSFYRLSKGRLPPTYTAFATALVVAYMVVGMQSAPEWYDWVLAFFNACLLFCSALGVNEVGVNVMSQPGQAFVAGQHFFTPWLRR